MPRFAPRLAPGFVSRVDLKMAIVVALLLLALPITVFAWAFPKASRVAIYQGELADPATYAAVAGVFTVERPDTDTVRATVDLGYAMIDLDEEPISVRQLRPGFVEIALSEGRIVAFAPFRWRGRNGVWDPVIGVVGAGVDPELDPFHGMKEDFGLDEGFQGSAGFDWNASTVRTVPVPAPAVWSMDNDEFGRLYLRTLFKAMEPANANGGWLIPTTDAETIVRFGDNAKPGRAHLAVWSRPGDLTQGLTIVSDSPEWSKRTARTVASTWRAMIEEAPTNHRELERLIDRGISNSLNRSTRRPTE